MRLLKSDADPQLGLELKAIQKRLDGSYSSASDGSMLQDAGGELANVTGAKEEFVAGDLGFGGVIA